MPKVNMHVLCRCSKVALHDQTLQARKQHIVATRVPTYSSKRVTGVGIQRACNLHKEVALRTETPRVHVLALRHQCIEVFLPLSAQVLALLRTISAMCRFRYSYSHTRWGS
jgi:hypothetical protein